MFQRVISCLDKNIWEVEINTSCCCYFTEKFIFVSKKDSSVPYLLLQSALEIVRTQKRKVSLQTVIYDLAKAFNA